MNGLKLLTLVPLLGLLGCLNTQAVEGGAPGASVSHFQETGLIERGWLPYGQALDLLRARSEGSPEQYARKHDIPFQPGERPRLTMWQEGQRVSEYLPAVLALIRKGNEVAQPRDPEFTRKIDPQNPHLGYDFDAERTLGRETRYYAHYLASQGRTTEAADAILTVLEFCRISRFGTKIELLVNLGMLANLSNAAQRLVLVTPPETAERLGTAFLEASEWVKDWVLQPEFEVQNDRAIAEFETTTGFETIAEYLPPGVDREDLILVHRDAALRTEQTAQALKALHAQPLHTWLAPQSTSMLEDPQLRELSDDSVGIEFNLDRLIVAKALGSSQMRVIDVLAKLRNYFWAHGRMPESLTDAMSEEETIDPATGEPFFYKRLDFYNFELGSEGFRGGHKFRIGRGVIFRKNETPPYE